MYFLSVYDCYRKEALALNYQNVSVIEQYEEIEGCNPGEISTVDLQNVQKLREELCEINVYISSNFLFFNMCISVVSLSSISVV